MAIPPSQNLLQTLLGGLVSLQRETKPDKLRLAEACLSLVMVLAGSVRHQPRTWLSRRVTTNPRVLKSRQLKPNASATSFERTMLYGHPEPAQLLWRIEYHTQAQQVSRLIPVAAFHLAHT